MLSLVAIEEHMMHLLDVVLGISFDISPLLFAPRRVPCSLGKKRKVTRLQAKNNITSALRYNYFKQSDKS